MFKCGFKMFIKEGYVVFNRSYFFGIVVDAK